MQSTRVSAVSDQKKYFNRFKEGDEKGFEFFYNRLYPWVYFYGFKYIKDDISADCIVSEAFLRLWLCRKNISCPEHIETFLRKVTADGCRAYYKTNANNFQRSMLRLDGIEDYQDFIGGYNPDYDLETDVVYYHEQWEEEKKQWERVEAILPNLSPDHSFLSASASNILLTIHVLLGISVVFPIIRWQERLSAHLNV